MVVGHPPELRQHSQALSFLPISKSKTPAFRAQVLTMFTQHLKLETWSDETADSTILPLSPDNLKLKRISGAFSNAVFFVSYELPSGTKGTAPNTVLLRVYGSGTEVLLSRRAELLILHTLSSLYEIGPHILGTFANGRVETFFDAEPIGKDGVRDLGDRKETLQEDGSLLVRGREGRAQWVARRMRQLHEVPLEVMRAVLEQGDLRAGNEGSGLFGRGIENHLFARSHRPPLPKPRSSIAQQGQPGYFDNKPLLPMQNPRDSPAAMTPSDGSAVPDTSFAALGKDGAKEQAMAIRGYSPEHRNNSVASFDSLATSYNSQDGGSMMSNSTESLAISPSTGPTSYTDSVAAARRGQSQSPYAFGSSGSSARRSSTSRGSSSIHRQPYPGVWRRTKRWAREAGKVFALVDEFAESEQGKIACEQALVGTAMEGHTFSPFPAQSPPRVHSLKLATTIMNLQATLLAIASIDFPRFLKEMDAYKRFVRRWERSNGPSRRVLAHGDTQYSNLLLIKEGKEDDVGVGMPRDRDRRERSVSVEPDGGRPEARRMPSRQKSRTRLAPYERLIVIDFEYCSPNPRAYDIANAFQEWRFDYHSPTDSWSPYNQPYPNQDQRRRWLRAYVEQGRLLRLRGKTSKSNYDSPAPTTPPPTDDLALPPSVMENSTNSKSSTTTHTDRESRPALKPDSSPIDALEGRSKSFTRQSVPSPSPSLFAGASPSLDPTSSPYMSGRSTLATLESSMQREIDRLEKEVAVYSVACHASWALWGMTFAKEQIEAIMEDTLKKMGADNEAILLEESDTVTEAAVAGSAESFDNVSSTYRSVRKRLHLILFYYLFQLRYALGRIELFREEIAALGICT